MSEVNVVQKAAVQLVFQQLAATQPKLSLSELPTTGGGTPSRDIPDYFLGDIPWFTVADFALRNYNPQRALTAREYITLDAINNSSAKLLPRNTVLFSTRVSIGKVAIAETQVATNQDFRNFLPVDDLMSSYIAYFLIALRESIQTDSRGTTIKGITVDVINRQQIPLVSLADQNQIVSYLETLNEACPLPQYLQKIPRIIAHIKALDTRVSEAKSIYQDIESEARHLLLSTYTNLVADAPYLPIAQIAPIVRRPIEVDPKATYYELGIRSFGKGTFHKPPVKGIDVGTKRLFTIEPGDLMFSNVFAWEGAIAVAQPQDKGRAGSHRFISCLPKQNIVTAEFLCFHFLTKEGLRLVREASPGGAGRNRTLGLEKLERIQVPVPSYNHQLWFNELQTRVEALKHLQAENSVDLDALLPSILDQTFNREFV